jgi:hypothetical protein
MLIMAAAVSLSSRQRDFIIEFGTPAFAQNSTICA